MADSKETPSQTAGPYVHIGCVPTFAGLTGMYGGVDPGSRMITGDPAGARITLSVRLIDGAGELLKDAMVEIWQPGPDGGFGPSDGFSHWGREPTHAQTGVAGFHTLKPGRSGDQAPHVVLWITARGINMGLMTRLYFPDEDNSKDAVFVLAGDRAATLVAKQTNEGYMHDICLQGANETVFFDV